MLPQACSSLVRPAKVPPCLATNLWQIQLPNLRPHPISPKCLTPGYNFLLCFLNFLSSILKRPAVSEPYGAPEGLNRCLVFSQLPHHDSALELPTRLLCGWLSGFACADSIAQALFLHPQLLAVLDLCSNLLEVFL